MANPERVINLPNSTQAKAGDSISQHQVPSFATTTRSSTAGASSGEFHVYKNAKRKNIDRQEEEESMLRAQNEAEDFEKRRREAQIRDKQKTNKNREKRRKRNDKFKNKAQSQNSTQPNVIAMQGSGSKPLVSHNSQREIEAEQNQEQTRDSSSQGIKIVEDTF